MIKQTVKMLYVMIITYVMTTWMLLVACVLYEYHHKYKAIPENITSLLPSCIVMSAHHE